MLIHVKLMDRGWIFEYAANKLKQYITSHDITISEYALDEADVNLYFNWHGLTSKTKGLDIPYFTHYEERLYKDVLPRLDLADGILCMSNDGYRMLRMITDRPIGIAPLGWDNLPKRKIVIGISGRTYKESDRKRVSDLRIVCTGLTEVYKSWLEFLFLGVGWEKIAEELNGLGVVTKQIFNSTDLEEKNSFYQKIDYYLSMGLDEGGPQGVLDAFHVGIPVISPAVGYMFDLIPDYTITHYWDLTNCLINIITERLRREVRVEGYTWQNFADSVIKFCESVPSVIEKQRKQKELLLIEERKQYS